MIGFDEFVDEREQQETLDIGLDAGATAGRSGAIAGTDAFEDSGRLSSPSNPGGSTEQTGLEAVDKSVGDGQVDLSGSDATTTVGGEWMDQSGRWFDMDEQSSELEDGYPGRKRPPTE